MSKYEIVDTNAENIGRCGFCGYKAGPISATRFMSIMRSEAEQADRARRGQASGPAQPCVCG